MSSPTGVRHFIVGGAGFLGSHIVQSLKVRGEQQVAVFDINPPSEEDHEDGVDYFTGSIVDEAKLLETLQEWKPDILYHTASPIHGLADAIYYEVNEKGTNVLLAACKSTGVKRVVYTSSTGVVWTGAEFAGITEAEAKVPPKGYDAYHHTKAIGERLVLNQNGIDGMTTVVLRPCGMTGERDKQLIWKLAKVLEDGQQNVQIGDNTNLVDYAYAGNVAFAHLLAADRLLSDPDSIAGEIFFITNGSPLPNWSFNRLIWRELGDSGDHKITVLPRTLAMFMAMMAELWSRVTGKPTEFNRFAIRFITGTQWYNIDKARSVLGYEPPVTLEEGIKRTAHWWKTVGADQHKRKSKVD